MLLLNYTFKNLAARRLTSILTCAGIALVVFVFCAVLMLSHGLDQTLVATGEDDNVIVIRQASETELQSIIYRDAANVIKVDPAVENVTSEILVLITQEKRGTDDISNVPVRGVTAQSMELRPSFKLVEGRMWNVGTSEIIAGTKVAGTFEGCGLGETVRFGMREWTVVGLFETGGSGFESELWGDVDQMMDAFGRPVFSSLTMRLKSPAMYEEIKQRLEDDPRLSVTVSREKQYYAKQSRFTTLFINALGLTISIIFSLGAIVGAMITMYAAVANRTVEIGTLRALG
ncbi:MAG: ABC transporter permease, partial [Desulfuromonadales bacterium]|nr:ABC transporter permease [Desulfuromonadales bacterium]